MTRIDDIFSLIGSKTPFFGAIQYTPWNILLTITEEKFWKFLDLTSSFNPKIKFIEKRSEDYVDIHYFFQNLPEKPLDITFRLSTPSSEFFNSLRENYLFIEIFLREF